MELLEGDLFTLSQCAVSAAYQAGHIISQYIGRDLCVKKKEGGESEASQVFTEVDLLSQNCILDILQSTCEAYDLALLAEESTDDEERLKKDYFWCIDPLDGTLPFIEGVPGYSVSIALVSRSGEPMIGVIYDPVTATMYSAVKGKGALCNSEAWTLKATIQNEMPLTFICDRSFTKHERYDEIVSQLKDVVSEFGYTDLKIISHGGAAMNACWALEQTPACYFKFPKSTPGGGSLWDYAASACIYNEIGAVTTDIHGQSLDLNRADSTFMNHRGVLYATDPKLAEAVQTIYESLV